jgi:outer membrane receptor protein involved in Fe transport
LGNVPQAPDLCNLSAYSQFISGTLVDPYNKSARFLCPQTSGPPQPCNEIPNKTTTGVSNVTDQAVALLNLLPTPTPNLPTDPSCSLGGEAVCNNFLASGQEVFNANQFDVRTDYNASSNLRLFGRYSFGQFYDNGTPAFGPDGGGLGTNPSGFGGVARTRNQNISSGFTYSLSPKFLTDFRFGYFRYRLNVDVHSGQAPMPAIPGIFFGQPMGVDNPFATGLPDFQIPSQQGLSSGGDYIRLGYSNVANSCNCPLREREQQFQFVNNWTRSAGKHIVKWGADLRFLQNYRLSNDPPPTGSFSFGPSLTGLGLATFLIGKVTSFDRTFSSPAVVNAGEHQRRLGVYGQDTWRINPRLTLNYGLRWEIYFPQTLTGAGGFLIPNLSNHDPATTFFSGPPDGGVTANLKNFAPRLGFAYLINPTTVVRAGYGRSFDAGYAGDIFGIAATTNPPVTVDQKIESAGFNLRDGPPQFKFPAAPFSLLDLAADNIGNPNAIPVIPPSGAVLYALPSQVRVPTVDSWNLTVQHELDSHLYFELAYVGNKGTHVFTDRNSGGTFYDLNQPSLQNLVVQTIADGNPTGFDLRNCKAFNKKKMTGAIFTSSDGQQQYCLSVPQLRSFYNQVEIPNDPCLPTICKFDPTLFQVRYFGNNANNNYNSLQAKVSKNFSRGYSFLAHYTWAKGLAYDQDYFAVDPRVGYGPANFDLRHRFVLTNIWQLPVGRGKAWLGGIGPAADRFVGGWTISAITIWRSGFPFTPSYVKGNCANDTDTGAPCRPNRVGLVHISGSREQYFATTGGVNLQPDKSNPTYCAETPTFCGLNPATGQPVPGPAMGPWQRPGAGQIGNAGRNSLTGPGFFQSDISVAKIISMTERSSLDFRADVFNVFNKVNLGNPNACVDCQGGGVISALTPNAIQREFQFSLRIQF